MIPGTHRQRRFTPDPTSGEDKPPMAISWNTGSIARSGTSGSGVLDSSGFFVAVHSQGGGPGLGLGSPVALIYEHSDLIADELAAVVQIDDRAPSEMVVTADGNLFVLHGGTVYRFDPGRPGTFTRIAEGVSQLLAGGDHIWIVDSFQRILDYHDESWAFVDSAGTQHVATRDGQLFRVSGQVLQRWTGEPYEWQDVAFNPEGFEGLFAGLSTVYFTPSFGGGQTYRLDWGGDWTSVSAAGRGVEFAVTDDGHLVRRRSDGRVEIRQNQAWRKIGEGADRIWAGNETVYLRREETGEVFEWIQEGLWDKLTRPVSKMAVGGGMIAATDEATQNLHRYRHNPEAPLFEAHLVSDRPVEDRVLLQAQKHYVLDVPEGTDHLTVHLESLDGNSFFVAGRREAKPTLYRSRNDIEAQGLADSVTIDVPEFNGGPGAGLWHFTVNVENSMAGDFELTVELESDNPRNAPCEDCVAYAGALGWSGDYDYQPNGSYFYSHSGENHAWLEGPEGTDFDLRLYRWNGFSWILSANSLSWTSEEEIHHWDFPGYYLWKVNSYSGSGEYDLWIGN